VRGPKEPTLREVLDAGSHRIEKELAGEPELQASMLTLVGRVYQRLGDNEKAQPLLERAVALGRARGIENEQMGQSLNDLGVLIGKKGDYASAAVVLEQALTMRRRVLGADHPEVAVTLVELGRACSDRASSTAPVALPPGAGHPPPRAGQRGPEQRPASAHSLLLRQKGELEAARPVRGASSGRARQTAGPSGHGRPSNLALVIGERGDPAGRGCSGRRWPSAAGRSAATPTLPRSSTTSPASCASRQVQRAAHHRGGAPSRAEAGRRSSAGGALLRHPGACPPRPSRRQGRRNAPATLATQRRAYGDADWRRRDQSVLGQA
jgi:hypothetical protein